MSRKLRSPFLGTAGLLLSAFVLVLLLPSVLVLNAVWHPAPSFGSALWRVIKVVSMFTIAHSITFSLAGLDLIPLPDSVKDREFAPSIGVRESAELGMETDEAVQVQRPVLAEPQSRP